MAVERTIPILACRALDDVVPFYTALGFEVTFRQARPNPYLCLNRGGLDLHFFALDTFDPEQSLGSVIVLVPDTVALFDAFATGLRAAYGKLPVAGIPRITRPRRKQGTAGGFTVVDPGGNWLRISSAGPETEEPSDSPLEPTMLNAARQADARGDVAAAIAVIEAGLSRHPEATPAQRVPALAYLAELLIRADDRRRAGGVLSELWALDLSDADRAEVRPDLIGAAELEAMLTRGGPRA